MPDSEITDRYDPDAIERKWQLVWEAENTWVVANPGSPEFDASKPKSYVLEMLPYPSGEPHVGHLKTYSVGDAIAHFRRRRGFSVVHPMGYDAFGLPAENNAIQTGEHPREATEKSIASFREQFMRWGISIDWTRELGTHQPELLPLDTVDLPETVRARTGTPARGARPLVPQGPDGARQRAGDRRTLRALRHPGGAPSARAVVLPDHGVRAAAARRLRAARVLAGERDHHAAELDRPLGGRGGRLPLRGARPRLPRLHHPSRHALRGDLLRAGPRASGGRAPGRRAPSTSERSASTSTSRPGRRPRSAPTRSTRRPACHWAARSSTRSTASASRCSSPTTC